jgi:hypothetical protein
MLGKGSGNPLCCVLVVEGVAPEATTGLAAEAVELAGGGLIVGI